MKRILNVICVSAAVSLISTATPMRAQQPQQPETPKLDPKACADRDRLTLGDIHEPKAKETTGSTPGEKLARTDGVICPPPHLDPDINAQAPGGGRTPVIPPSKVEPGTQAK
jgi:hypothetical protein